ncbi:nucleotide sugar dehydrogenase [Yaniella halotolerans]|uniref:nucleotide sugar dehydrogenase n=1 Tax=Yaniella halotolerans TaxID=225453 RepID=UPI0003B2F626|nr:nucleotide sugar dehydrogenase [Yaniella halotolerans]
MTNVSVIGLGKIGLPLAVQFASKGHQVTGVDINQNTVDTINEGKEPFPGEAYLQEKLQHVINDGKLSATTSYQKAIPNSEVVVIVVPLFVDTEGVPDFAWMDTATQELARHLTKQTLVSYETTLPVGTTRTRWKPMIEQTSGLVEGEDFHLVFSPERVLTGRVFEDLRRYPKLIGALSQVGAKQAQQFYETALDFDDRIDLERANGVWDLGSAEAAEMAKLAETTYRDVNIGLANEFARFAGEHGIDIYSVIEASNSQPYSHIHRPGIAVGGHCIPVYPRLYLWNDPEAEIVRTARATNMTMPKTAVNILDAAHGSIRNQHVVVLGASYRGGVKETAFSGVFPTVEELRTRGALVSVHDPLYSDQELVAMGFAPYQLGENIDAAVIQADHAEYRSLTPKDLPGIKTLLDGRNITDSKTWSGVTHLVIGRPASDSR